VDNRKDLFLENTSAPAPTLTYSQIVLPFIFENHGKGAVPHVSRNPPLASEYVAKFFKGRTKTPIRIYFNAGG
jgi:hypothetical protein